MYSWNLYYKWLCSAEEGKSDRGYSPLACMLSCRDMVTVLEPERIREKLYQITSEIAKRYEGERESWDLTE